MKKTKAMYDYDAEDEQDLGPSKSELKRQMLALQELEIGRAHV